VWTGEDLVGLARSGAGLETQRAALAEALEDRGVGAVTVGHLLEHVRDGIVLRGADQQRRSRIGGLGLLPARERWPHDPLGHPLSFLAAIDLAELPAMEPLPVDGTLIVYWDFIFHELPEMDFVAATRVYWVPAGQAVREQSQPKAALSPELVSLAVAGVAMPIAGEQEKVVRKVGDAPDRQALIEAMNELAPVLYRHQLLGASRDIQGPVLDEIPYWFQHTFPETRARFTEAERTDEDWLLPAQIGEDSQIPRLGFGDAGNLYLVLPEADLRARRFDRVMGIMQCH
jgi:hypothetical protein